MTEVRSSGDTEQRQLIEEIRASYRTAIPLAGGKTIPKWGYFDREAVGVLLDEIDRLQSALATEREACATTAENAYAGDIPTYVEHDALRNAADAIRRRDRLRSGGEIEQRHGVSDQ